MRWIVISRISLLWKIAAAAGLLAFFYLVWPTPYRYDHIRVRSDSTVVRINRLTGDSEMLALNKWVRIHAAEGPEENLVPADLKKLTGGAYINDQGHFGLTLYNGSEFNLKDITVEITIRGKSGEAVLSRLYRMTPDLAGGGPLEMASFDTDLVPPWDSGNNWDWHIVSAKGIRVH
jgi:hypothetical protein